MNFHKIYILISYIVCVFCISINAQSPCYNTLNTISTSWRNYRGHNVATGQPSNRLGDGSSINNWDWTSTSVQSIYKAHGLPEDNGTGPVPNDVARVYLPYFCPNQVGGGSCQNPNTLPYELLPYEEQDIQPENGWELIAKNFGTPYRQLYGANGAATTIQAGFAVTGHPFFILYNRHTGVMKIFILRFGDIQNVTANTALVKVLFTNVTNSINGQKTQVYRNLFGFSNQIVMPNESMDKDKFSSSPNRYANPTNPSDHYWLVANLVSLYDPCTCESEDNRPTIFNVDLELTNISQLNAEINGQTSNQPGSQNSGEINNPLSPVSNFFSQYSGYIDKVRDMVNKAPTKKRQEIADKWYLGVKGRTAYIASNAGDRLNELNNAIGILTNVSPANVQNVKELSKFIGTVETIASIFPYISSALGVINMFIGSEEAPNVSYVNLRLKGALSEAIPTPTPALYLPGSPNQTGQPGLKPIYNNTLGVFNILKAPKVEYANIKNRLDRERLPRNRDLSIAEMALLLGSQERDYSGDFDRLENEQHLKQYRLKEDIKFVINPASKMEVRSIEACFVTEMNEEQATFRNHVGSFGQTTQTPFIFGYRTDSDGYLTAQPFQFDQSIENDQRLKEFGWELEYVSSNFMNFQDSPGSFNSEEFIRYRTSYVPLQCLKNTNFIMLGAKSPKVYVKMLIKLGYKDAPLKAPITHVVTYDISKSFETSNLVNSGLEGWVTTKINYAIGIGLVQRGDFLGIPIMKPALLFSNPHYMAFEKGQMAFPNPYYDIEPANQTYSSGQSGTRIINGDLTIPAGSVVPANTIFRVSGKVDIGAGVTFGNNVEIYSGTEINNDPENTYNPNVTFIIEGNTDALYFSCTPGDISNNQATTTEITDMCSSQEYRGRAYPTKSDTDEGQEKEDIEDKTNIFPFTAAPNPFNEGGVRIDFGLEQSGRCMVTVHDILGKQVAVLLSTDTAAEGPQQLFWDAADAPVGIYFVTLHTEQGRQSIKVSKQ